LWVVSIDPEGAVIPSRQCKHVNYISNSHIAHTQGPNAGQPREAEFLFAAYSIFTVRSVVWGMNGAPHRIEIDAASDNRGRGDGGDGRWAIPENCNRLPLVLWY
jgi:hypothetical protein